MSDWPLIQWKWQWDWYTPDVVKIAEYYEVEHAQQPSPADQLLLAEAAKSQAIAALDTAKAQTEGAKAVETLADAHLKNAQATALGGPDEVPQTPTGLTPVDPIDQVAKLAGAKLKVAQANKLQHDTVLGTHDAGINYLGAIDITVDKAFTDGAVGVGVPNAGSEIDFVAQTVYGLLEARAAYTPISAEVFTPWLEALQN